MFNAAAAAAASLLYTDAMSISSPWLCYLVSVLGMVTLCNYAGNSAR